MATNSHVVYIRGLTPEKHRMLSALAAQSQSRTLNGYMLEVIDELLAGGRPLRPSAPGQQSRISAKIETWILPGSPEWKAMPKAEREAAEAADVVERETPA